ncbi:MAG: hypothetical protein ABH847_00620 [Candidatus Omnitrophota bacterium]
MKNANINKIITLILALVWLFVMWKALLSPPSKIVVPAYESNSEGKATSEESTETLDDIKFYTTILERLKAPFDITRYQGLLTRNIFIKPEKPLIVFSPESLRLVSVEPIVLPFVYKGYIQTASGTIIGQVNWGEKTYFIKKGDKFKDYKVIDIQRKTLTVEGKEGLLFLEFKKPAKGKELIAKVYNELDQKTYELRKEEELNNYKILDITADSVVIWGENKEWVIKKGR